MRLRTVGLAILALTLALFALPQANAQQDRDGDDAALAFDDARLNAIIPGFYAVDAFDVPSVLDVDLDPDTGYLWTTDVDNGEIDVLRPDGSTVMSVGAGQISVPFGVTVAEGFAYVADGGGDNEIEVFDTDGSWIRTIGTGGNLPCAVHVHGGRLFARVEDPTPLRVYNANTGALINAVDGSASGQPWDGADCDNGNTIALNNNEVHIVDEFEDRVMVFDTALNWKRDIAVVDSADGIDIAADTMWITEAGADLIVQYTLAGTELARFDLRGSGLGQIFFPTGIEVDTTGSTFWVADTGNDRVQVFTRLRCGGDLLTIVGSSASETLNGTPGNDVIHLGEGADTSNAGIGDDAVCGGGGNDTIFGSDGDDDLRGQDGRDTLEGELGNDKLYGGRGNDVAYGFDGDDQIFGGDDDDKLFGGKGADNIEGESGDDTIHGNRGDDELDGGDGDDRIFGYSENDIIDGGAGDDRLHGHFGDDTIRGGTGHDRIFGYGDDDTLHGGEGDDLIGGNFGNDELNGDGGNDTLYGSGDNDAVNGGDGNDVVEGNSGNDELTGGSGNDALDGGINNDSCNGNSGTDTATRCETTVGIP